MDFTRYNPRTLASQVATLCLTDPDTGAELLYNGKPIEFDFYGLDSRIGREAGARLAKVIARRQKADKGVDVATLDVDTILDRSAASEAETARFYAEVCADMRNVGYIPDDKLDDPEFKPTVLKYSTENAELFFRTRPWFMPQVDDFLGNRLNWRKASARRP